MIYFAPEAQDAYARLGLTHHRTGYFASRSAAMGPVPADVVVATFFNFYPRLGAEGNERRVGHRHARTVLEARLEGADAALRRAFGEAIGSTDLAEVAGIARQAAVAACEDGVHGRPLFAGHASLPWPDEAHLILWHAQTLLREYRGDGHIAVLTAEGLSGVEALVTHAATNDIPSELLASSRAWPQPEWDAAIERLAARGLVDASGQFTDAGREQRQRIEDRTDALSLPAYAGLSDDDAERFVQLGRPFSRMVIEAGLLSVDPNRWFTAE